jgi:hypothetical protein
MRAVGSRRDRYVSAVIDEYARRGLPGARDRANHQAVKQGRIESALPNLNQLDAGVNRFVEEGFERKDLIAHRARIGIDCAPVSDETKTRSRQRDHDAGGESEAALLARITLDRSRSPVNVVTSPMPVTPPFTNALLIHSPMGTIA